MKLERVLRGTAATIHATFTQDGVAADPEPDSATVTLTRLSDGATLGPYDAYDEGTGEFSHTLTPAEAGTLDTFVATWTVTAAGYEQAVDSTVEVAGGFLFPLAALGAIKLGQSATIATTYTTKQMIEARTLAETSLEDACNLAFVPRYKRETLNGEGGQTVMLEQSNVTAIRDVTISGSTVNLADVTLAPSGVIYMAARTWPRGFQNVVVGFEHGRLSPPPRVSQAALLLARRWLVDGPVDDRATSVSMEGVGTYALSTPGMRGSEFGLPEVDAVVKRYDMNVLVA